ncbi:MAG: hypothetical protein SGILL_002507 [Bacillariaceae sp.]
MMIHHLRLSTLWALGLWMAVTQDSNFVNASFLKKSTGSAAWASGLAYHPATKEYIIAGTGYDSPFWSLSTTQRQANDQHNHDSYCTLLIGDPEQDSTDSGTMDSYLLSEPQVCMGGVLAVPGAAERVAHVMGTTASAPSANSSSAPIDTVLQSVLYNHKANTVQASNSVDLPKYSYPVASTNGYGTAAFVALHDVLNGQPTHAHKLLYHPPAPATSGGTVTKKEKLEEFLAFKERLTDPEHIRNHPESTAARSPRTPHIIYISDPLNNPLEQKKYNIQLRTDEPSGAATIASMKFHHGKNWLIVGGSVYGTGRTFGNTTLGKTPNEAIQGDDNAWNGFVSFFDGESGAVVDNPVQTSPFRIRLSEQHDYFVNDICLDEGDVLVVVGTFRGTDSGAFIQKYSLTQHKLLWEQHIPHGDTLKDLHCVVSPHRKDAPPERTLYVGGETEKSLSDGLALPTKDVVVRAYNLGSGSIVWSKQLDTAKLYHEKRQDFLSRLEINPDNSEVVVALVNSMNTTTGTNDVVFFDMSRASGSSLLDAHQVPPKDASQETTNENAPPSSGVINTNDESGTKRGVILIACMIPVLCILSLAYCQWRSGQASSSSDGSVKQNSTSTVASFGDPRLGDAGDEEEGFFDECDAPPPTDSFQFFHEQPAYKDDPDPTSHGKGPNDQLVIINL